MSNLIKMPELDEFPLSILRQTPQKPMALHTHDFVELVVILEGQGWHFSHEDAYEIMAGDCFVVSDMHGYRDTKNLKLANILFYPSRLGLPMAEARKLPGYHAFFALEPRYRQRHKFRSCLRLSMNELSRVSSLMDLMEAELKTRKAGFEFMATTLLMELIGRLSRAYAGVDNATTRPLMRLGTVLSHMEQHYMEPIPLTQLTRMAHMSHSTLLRTFQEITGFSPVDYLIRLRIHRACDLLRTNRLNVTETAFRVGFNDSNYFARQFRRVMNCPPKDYARHVDNERG